MTNLVTDTAIIIQEIQTLKPTIVGIDGIDGVGKTSIAKDIEKLGYIRISLDEYLRKKSGGYYEFIEFDKLQSKLLECAGKFIVIEGLLLQKILERVQIKVNYLIYATDSVWIYDWSEEWQGKYSTMSLEDIIKDTEHITSRVSKALDPSAQPYKMDGLRREIYEYTFHYKPWGKAQIVFRSN